MKKTLCLFLLVAIFRSATAQVDFDYDRQSEWGGACNTGGMRQSPINIVTADVQVNENLIPLEFDDRWTAELNGMFFNNGHGVRFIESGGRATLRNHLGRYNLLNLHLHWGPQNDNGTGHEFDTLRTALEFHFVLIKDDAAISSFEELDTDAPGDTVSVVCVLAVANDSLPNTGIWSQIDPTLVLNANDTISVTGLRYLSFLPENRDYYHYPGSATSPGCYEAVQWFVLKDKIQVPSAYLDQLRTTRFDNGEQIVLNYRQPQPLFDRVVSTPPSGAVGVVSLSMLVVASALLACGLLLLIGGQ